MVGNGDGVRRARAPWANAVAAKASPSKQPSAWASRTVLNGLKGLAPHVGHRPCEIEANLTVFPTLSMECFSVQPVHDQCPGVVQKRGRQTRAHELRAGSGSIAEHAADPRRLNVDVDGVGFV